MAGLSPSNLQRHLEAWISPTAVWATAALVWAAFVLWSGLLNTFRSARNSSLAGLIEFKDVPILEFFQTHYASLAWACAVMGVLLVAAAVLWARQRRSRPSCVLAGTTGAAVLLALVGNRYSGEGDAFRVWTPGALDLVHWGLLDWLFLLALLLTTRAFMGAMVDALEEPTEADEAVAAARRPASLALVYLLCVFAVASVGAWEHLRMWDPARNGGYDYQRFFLHGEVWTANLVLFSTSFLFASVAGVAACLLCLAFRWAAGAGGGLRRDLIREASLASLVLALVATVPWLARLTIEIKGEQNWFFPLGVIVFTFALLAPLLFVSALLIQQDFEEHAGDAQQVAVGTGERVFLTALLFPLYPALRAFQPVLRRMYLAGLMLVAFAVLGGLTWLAHEAPNMWEFEDWRGMMKKAQFPATRVFLSLGVAAAVALLLQRFVAWWRPHAAPSHMARALRWGLNAVALVCLAFATWPLWGWGNVSKNVLARTAEYNDRHEFEREFLLWVLDFDGDGYAGLMGGGDPDDSDPAVQGAGVRKLEQVAVPLDGFQIVDPSRAARFPNMVLIYLEGVTARSISAYGERRLENNAQSTPGMDEVAHGGTRFTRAYCPYPSTWDGWFTVLSGRELAIEEFTSALPFGDRYSRYNNLLKVLKLIGFNRFCQPNVSPYVKLFVPEEDQREDWEPAFSSSVSQKEKDEGVTKGDKRLERILRFIDSIKPGERFFLAEHMADTHFPWKRTQREVAERLGYPNGMSFVEEDAYVDGQFIPKLAKYYHTITRMDTQVRAILARLKKRDLYDNTMVVVVSDHGCQWYEHEHAYYVSHLYEQSLRIPLLIRVPGLAKNVASDVPVVQMDVLPTVMELAGVALSDPSRPLFGQSMLPLMLGGDPPEEAMLRLEQRDLLLKTHYDTLGLIANFRHKLIFDRPTGATMLFDLASDPMEMVNLADSRPELLKKMMKRLRAAADRHMAFLGGIKPSE